MTDTQKVYAAQQAAHKPFALLAVDTQDTASYISRDPNLRYYSDILKRPSWKWDTTLHEKGHVQKGEKERIIDHLTASL